MFCPRDKYLAQIFDSWLTYVPHVKVKFEGYRNASYFAGFFSPVLECRPLLWVNQANKNKTMDVKLIHL